MPVIAKPVQPETARRAAVIALSTDQYVGAFATVKETTRTQMVNDLLALRIGYAKRPGSEWEALREAVQRGSVTTLEASPIVEAAARQLVGRVTSSMDLEAQQVPDVEVAKMLAETTSHLTADLG